MSLWQQHLTNSCLICCQQIPEGQGGLFPCIGTWNFWARQRSHLQATKCDAIHSLLNKPTDKKRPRPWILILEKDTIKLWDKQARKVSKQGIRGKNILFAHPLLMTQQHPREQSNIQTTQQKKCSCDIALSVQDTEQMLTLSLRIAVLTERPVKREGLWVTSSEHFNCCVSWLCTWLSPYPNRRNPCSVLLQNVTHRKAHQHLQGAVSLRTDQWVPSPLGTDGHGLRTCWVWGTAQNRHVLQEFWLHILPFIILSEISFLNVPCTWASAAFPASHRPGADREGEGPRGRLHFQAILHLFSRTRKLF